MRYFIFSVVAVAILSGCSAKEINAGVNDATDGVVRVIRGTNN